MFTADQIILHLLGDYFFQSDWMAMEKTKRWFPALLHGFVYSLPFLALLYSLGGGVILPWAIICLSHSIIDRYRLVRYLIWGLNRASPKSYRYRLKDLDQTCAKLPKLDQRS